MTAYEILKYMAWIRGTPRHRIHREVEKWLKRMDLTRYKHVKIKCYSGGTKRKLNTAIAMVINVKMIVMNITNNLDDLIVDKIDCCTTINTSG